MTEDETSALSKIPGISTIPGDLRRKRLAEAKALVRRHVVPGTSLVDELLQERLEAAKRE